MTGGERGGPFTPAISCHRHVDLDVDDDPSFAQLTAFLAKKKWKPKKERM